MQYATMHGLNLAGSGQGAPPGPRGGATGRTRVPALQQRSSSAAIDKAHHMVFSILS